MFRFCYNSPAGIAPGAIGLYCLGMATDTGEGVIRMTETEFSTVLDGYAYGRDATGGPWVVGVTLHSVIGTTGAAIYNDSRYSILWGMGAIIAINQRLQGL